MELCGGYWLSVTLAIRTDLGPLVEYAPLVDVVRALVVQLSKDRLCHSIVGFMSQGGSIKRAHFQKFCYVVGGVSRLWTPHLDSGGRLPLDWAGNEGANIF